MAEGKRIISALATLKYELQHNRVLTPIDDDGAPDVELYNAELAARGPPKWHDVEWLFSECYLYRRISVLFSMATTRAWKGYDCFARQKMETFRSSRPAVVELAGRYREIVSQIRGSKEHRVIKGGGSGSDKEEEDAERTLFVEMSEICLWGNATDLSLLTSLTYEDIQKLQGSEARRESEKNVLVNDLGKAFEVLKRAEREEEGKRETRRVDIVLDNAGFELFVDLVLAGYLVSVGLATEVVLHPKSVPWFVSDVVPGDFANLLDVMRDPRGFYEKDGDGKELTEQEESDIKFLFEDWRELHEDGKLILRPNRFWTHAGSFWRMPHVAPEVLEDLKESELVVFKGDLNYRKLTGDVCPVPAGVLRVLWREEADHVYPRLRGRPRRRSYLRLGRWVHRQESGFLRCERARLMLWWVCLRVRMRRFVPRRVEEGTPGRGCGRGVGNGLSFSSVMGRLEATG